MSADDPTLEHIVLPPGTEELLLESESEAPERHVDVEDPFSGQFSTAAGLERIRKRLLDLTRNNRLLNYRFPKSKVLRVVDTPPDALFDRLYVEGKSTSIVAVPDPTQEEYEKDAEGILRKPEVKKHAESLGISTSYELASGTENQNGSRMQALLYPEDLETLLRKMDQAARTAIEESGTNMLYLVFGFLEWYESADSDKPMLAPLMILPVGLKRGAVDPTTGFFQYALEYSGEDLSENLTLRQKLKMDFSLTLPELVDTDSPESYFTKIEQFVYSRQRWKLRRQVCVCLLSFGKLLMYLDLDPAKWPPKEPLNKHSLVSMFFEGVDREKQQAFADEYHIDEEPAATKIPLVCDADSSQHSALIDALQGYNMVIEGPPGTGKSQTITNLIAAELTQGKTVLFVSEKLAALEVVRRNLDRVHLGKFCLELHSHKTQKKRLLEDIKERRESTFLNPAVLDNRLQVLEDKKNRLKRYAHAINSVRNNHLELTVHDVLWAAERYRLALGDNKATLLPVELKDVDEVNAVRLAHMGDAIQQLARHLSAIDKPGPGNPWYGYFPNRLLFDDDATVRTILQKIASVAEALSAILAQGEAEMQLILPKTREASRAFLAEVKDRLPRNTGNEAFELLPKLHTREAIAAVQTFEEQVQFINENAPTLEQALRSLEAINDKDMADAKSWLETTAKINQSGILYSDLLSRAEGTTSLAASLMEALEFFRSTMDAIKITPAMTQKGIALIRAAIRVAAAAPLQHMDLRRPQWLEPEASKVVTDAKVEAQALKPVREKLNSLFTMTILPPRADIALALRAFLSSGGLFRIFRREWRISAKLYKRIKFKRRLFLRASECAEELSGLLNFIDARAKFEQNSDYRRVMREHFKGVDTDFSRLQKVTAWYDFAKAELIHFIEPGKSFKLQDILELHANKLEWLATHATKLAQQWDVLTLAGLKFEGLFPSTTQPVHLRYGESDDMAVFQKNLEQLATTLKEIGAGLERLFRVQQSAKSAVNILETLSKVRALRAKISNNRELPGYLGSHYRGLETDFAPIDAVIAWCQQAEQTQLPAVVKSWLFTPRCIERVNALRHILGVIDVHWQNIEMAITSLGQFGTFDWKDWHGESYPVPDKVAARAGRALGAMHLLTQWADFSRAIQATREISLGELCDCALAGNLEPDDLEDALHYCVYQSIAKVIMRNNPEFMQFSGLSHDEIKRRFIELDDEVI